MIHYPDIINMVIKKDSKYLEIGAADGASMNLIRCNSKVGIDACYSESRNKNLEIYQMTSSDFFKVYSGDKFDVIFIDGSHNYVDVYEDIKKSIDLIGETGTILLHDSFPKNEIECRRESFTFLGIDTDKYKPIELDILRDKYLVPGFWLGEVWKAVFDVYYNYPNIAIYTLGKEDLDKKYSHDSEFMSGVTILKKTKTKRDIIIDKENYNFPFYEKNREIVMNVISFEELKYLVKTGVI